MTIINKYIYIYIQLRQEYREMAYSDNKQCPNINIAQYPL